MQNIQTILLIGASRGLGLALAQEWLSRGVDVVATVRGGQTPLHELMPEHKDHLSIEQLEITDPVTVEGLHGRLVGRRFDTLFVNAGVALGPGDRIDRVSTEEFCRVMLTNALSPMRIVERLGPLVKDEGTIAVMSSSLGSVALNETGGWEAYRGSKAALNMLMRSYAARHANDKRSLALVDPGWVRTEMGGDDAALSIEESIPGVVDNLTAQRGKPGLRYFDYKGASVPW